MAKLADGMTVVLRLSLAAFLLWSFAAPWVCAEACAASVTETAPCHAAAIHDPGAAESGQSQVDDAGASCCPAGHEGCCAVAPEWLSHRQALSPSLAPAAPAPSWAPVVASPAPEPWMPARGEPPLTAPFRESLRPLRI